MTPSDLLSLIISAAEKSIQNSDGIRLYKDIQTDLFIQALKEELEKEKIRIVAFHICMHGKTKKYCSLCKEELEKMK